MGRVNPAYLRDRAADEATVTSSRACCGRVRNRARDRGGVAVGTESAWAIVCLDGLELGPVGSSSSHRLASFVLALSTDRAAVSGRICHRIAIVSCT